MARTFGSAKIETRTDSALARGAERAPAHDSEDDGLLVAARAKDHRAIEILISRHLRMMHRLAYRLAGPADLDDIVQDSVVLVMRSLPKLRHADNLGTWFASVVASVARKANRRRRMLSRLGFVEAHGTEWREVLASNAPADVAAELRAVSAALDRLPARSREALVLRRIEQRPLDEIGVIMGASLASVKRWVAVADRLLEAELAKGVRNG